MLKKLPSRFGLLLIGLFITTLGDWFTFIALSMRTFEETGMGKSVGLLLLARVIPNADKGDSSFHLKNSDKSRVENYFTAAPPHRTGRALLTHPALHIII
ncbi:hypothetical protein [Thermoanaerobacter sp. A7A]|uniref:hypothetical protein n=1 Tax=Thermoanaerobacter sp. A7A TaxID=1350366 RepID=UPI0004A3D7EE|nr:hypothetical protein [Thermoanaerobacter sp. A7A]